MLSALEAGLDVAVRAVAAARRVVVASGAGMSQESGIPTFREALSGLWAEFDPDEVATEAAFRRDPAKVFGWYAWRRRVVRQAEPHPGYAALVRLERQVEELVVVTQNVDGLHRRAGNRRVHELHGSLERFVCVDGRHPFPADRVPVPADDGPLAPPPCATCGSPVRPAVVWFGEMLPEREVMAAWDAAASCEVMLVVGTSGLVHPAAALPRVARDAGATIIEINPSPSELSTLAHVACRGPAGAVLPELVQALEGLR